MKDKILKDFVEGRAFYLGSLGPKILVKVACQIILTPVNYLLCEFSQMYISVINFPKAVIFMHELGRNLAGMLLKFLVVFFLKSFPTQTS